MIEISTGDAIEIETGEMLVESESHAYTLTAEYEGYLADVATVYVNGAAGDDGNTGSRLDPVKTIGRGIVIASGLSPGPSNKIRVMVEGGGWIYRESVDVPHDVYLVGIANPVISGLNVLTATWAITPSTWTGSPATMVTAGSASYWAARGFVDDFYVNPDGGAADAYWKSNYSCDIVIVNGVRYKQVGEPTYYYSTTVGWTIGGIPKFGNEALSDWTAGDFKIIGRGHFHYDKVSGKLYVNPLPGVDLSTAVVEVAQRAHGVNLGAGSALVGFEVRDHRLAYWANGAFAVSAAGAANVLVKDCEIHHNDYIGIFFQGENFRMIGCNIHDNGQLGAVCSGSRTEISLYVLTYYHVKNALFEGCVFSNNNTRGYPPQIQAGATKFTYLRDSKFLRCRFEDEQCIGLWFDIMCGNNLIAECEFTRCGLGIFYECSRWLVVANCKFEGCNVGVQLNAATDVLVAHNEFTDCMNAVLVQGPGRTDDGTGQNRIYHEIEAGTGLEVTVPATTQVCWILNNSILGMRDYPGQAHPMPVDIYQDWSGRDPYGNRPPYVVRSAHHKSDFNTFDSDAIFARSNPYGTMIVSKSEWLTTSPTVPVISNYFDTHSGFSGSAGACVVIPDVLYTPGSLLQDSPWEPFPTYTTSFLFDLGAAATVALDPGMNDDWKATGEYPHF